MHGMFQHPNRRHAAECLIDYRSLFALSRNLLLYHLASSEAWLGQNIVWLDVNREFDPDLLLAVAQISESRRDLSHHHVTSMLQRITVFPVYNPFDALAAMLDSDEDRMKPLVIFSNVDAWSFPYVSETAVCALSQLLKKRTVIMSANDRVAGPIWRRLLHSNVRIQIRSLDGPDPDLIRVSISRSGGSTSLASSDNRHTVVLRCKDNSFEENIPIAVSTEIRT